MSDSLNIEKMIREKKIVVPDYQRAYSWETSQDGKENKHTNVFVCDLEDYIKSKATTPYYFGHFLFENKGEMYAIIDGQQRLTTIVIFLSALFKELKSRRELNEDELQAYEDMVKRGSKYKFETVAYDSQFFKDYVIDSSKTNDNTETVSAQRIAEAYKFFISYLKGQETETIEKLLNAIKTASCTTHIVENETEAIQMFIFQNNRGKKPSNLEIVKAQFMFHIHLYGQRDTEELINEVKTRFEKIYKSISRIENRINEDDVLVYTLRVYNNSLREGNSLERIDKKLSEGNDSIIFIKDFTRSLEESFDYLTQFFDRDEKEYFFVHSLVSLGSIALALPFVIKAYKFNLSIVEKERLYNALESLILRDRLIGTRADMISRLNDIYQSFSAENPSVTPIVERVQYLKETSDWWWAYWNNEQLEYSVNGYIKPYLAKYILWKYENYLEAQGKGGYNPIRFDRIESPELEHISPQTPTNGEPIAAGYSEYDEDFKREYLDCLGNYLLLSKSHNCSIGNSPFKDKRDSYTYLAQQREIQKMTNEEHPLWTKELINERYKKIVEFIMSTF